jgi:hypothetical protein
MICSNRKVTLASSSFCVILHDVRPSYPPLSAAKLHQCYLHSSTGNKDILLAKKEVEREAERCNEVFSSLASAISLWKGFSTFQR